MKKTLITVLIIPLALFFLSEGNSFAAKRGGKISTQTRSAVSKKSSKKYKRRFKYVAPPKDELAIEAIPLSLPISAEVADELVKNDIGDAIRIIRTEPPSSRALALLKSMETIDRFKKDGKAPKVERNLFYRNLGISYHNLFLFLKRKGLSNKEFYKMAVKYYQKSLKTISPSEKIEGSILIAELKAQNGEIEAAKRIFEKLDIEPVGDNPSSVVNIAAYYAAVGDKDNAFLYLKDAHNMDPEKVSIWLAIGDDFLNIEDEPEFKKLQKK